MDILQYKTYDAVVEYDAEREVWSGKILYIDDFVSFEAKHTEEIQQCFEAVVDDYLETCQSVGHAPETPKPGRAARMAAA